jgi:SAM-dependent methyltransferase
MESMALRAWDVYARSKKPRRLVNAAGERTWFNWTQYPDHGPGAELLNPESPGSVLDLGCGEGGNAAHLATLGVQMTGVDWSQPQIDAARERWGDLPGLDLVVADVVEYLGTSTASWDAVYSVFGAVWFLDPETLLPLIRRRLRAGGQLVFAHLPPVEGCYGAQAAFVRSPETDEPLPIRRWDYTPEMWCDHLVQAGFDPIEARVIPSPEGATGNGTLLVRARSQGTT